MGKIRFINFFRERLATADLIAVFDKSGKLIGQYCNLFVRKCFQQAYNQPVFNEAQRMETL